MGRFSEKKLSKITFSYVQILRRDPCVYCGNLPESEEVPSTIDHIHAHSTEGSSGWENLAAACKSCNSSKGQIPLLHFMLYRQLGFSENVISDGLRRRLKKHVRKLIRQHKLAQLPEHLGTGPSSGSGPPSE